MRAHQTPSAWTRVLWLGIVLLGLSAVPALALAPPHDSTNSIDCSSCHAAHGGGFGFKPTGAQQTALCFSCHNESGQAPAMTNIGTEVHGATAGPNVDCGYCHDVHATQHGTNISLIRTNTTKYVSGAAEPVLFEETPRDYAASTGPPYKGVCQTCHQTTSYHRSDGTGGTLHESDDPDTARGGNCLTCHDHGSSFEPAGGTSCTGCHSSARGSRREVVSEFSLASHHADTVTDDDCQVCHDQSQHKTTPFQVRLKDVDAGTVVATLAGDPATSSTEAVKLEPHCLSCHDTDGANGDFTPFSDGVTRPVIDDAAWTASSHKASPTNPLTCYGDGTTFGCHASGHGSAKAKLRAPSAGAPIPPDNLAEEEGFCFTCHDSDGPATSDINTLFARTYHHPINNSDAKWPGNGRNPECAACHDPHAATAADPLKGVSGVDAAGSLVSPITQGYQLCFRCHANYTPGAGDPPGGADPTGNKNTQFNIITAAGTATSDGTNTTLNDSTAGWTPGALVGWRIDFFSGDGEGLRATITSNTATQVTFSPDIGKRNATATGDVYRIVNGTFHPVKGAQNNPYCSPTAVNGNVVTMESPWNQTADTHNTMGCSDCHSGGPHGSNTERMLAAGLSAVDDVATGVFYTPLCVVCHKYSVYVGGANGSAFGDHDHSNHRKADGAAGYGGCLSCHYGSKSPMTDAHGGSSATATFMTGSRVSVDPITRKCTATGDGTCGGHGEKSY